MNGMQRDKLGLQRDKIFEQFNTSSSNKKPNSCGVKRERRLFEVQAFTVNEIQRYI